MSLKEIDNKLNFPLFLKILPHHWKCLCDNVLNTNKTPDIGLNMNVYIDAHLGCDLVNTLMIVCLI